MDFAATVSVIVRRWFLALASLLLMGMGAAALYHSIPITYQSSAVLVLTTPTTGPTAEIDPQHPNGITNPLLNFDSGLSLTASILIQALSAPGTVASLGIKPGGPSSYVVTDGSTNPELLASGPFVYIQGTSSSADGARDIVRRVSDLAVSDLAERQRRLEAPESTYIRLVQVVPPTEAHALKGGRTRALGAAAALGLFASLATVFAAESLSHRRRARSTRDPDNLVGHATKETVPTYRAVQRT